LQCQEKKSKGDPLSSLSAVEAWAFEGKKGGNGVCPGTSGKKHAITPTLQSLLGNLRKPKRRGGKRKKEKGTVAFPHRVARKR